MANKWMKTLNKLEGATDFEYNPFAPENVIKSTSPYLNWIFGKGSGMPLGHGVIFYGPPKSGKSLATYLLTAGLHQSDPEAIVVKFNTEMREASQVSGNWGIDMDRYMAYDVNEPQYIFDRIESDILPLVQQGMPLKMIIIDSLKGIRGIKEMNSSSVTDHQMGDQALTIQKGLTRILPIIRRNKIALVCTEQIRANLDAGMYGKKEKMGGAWAEKHFFEYYIEVKRNNSAEAKQSLTGEKFETDTKDARGNKEKTAHKIYVRMDDSTVGVSNRSGIFTFNYKEGHVNIEEELFDLAKNLNIVERPNNRTYVFEGQTFTSKGDFIKAIKENEEISKKILDEIYGRDAVS